MSRQPAVIGAVISGIAFLVLVGLMAFDADAFNRLDVFATSLIHPLQAFPSIETFVAFTTIGGTTGIIILTSLAIFLLRKDRLLCIRLVALLVLESASVQLIKSHIGRVRPDALPWIGPLHSFSFPSGHATSAMAFFGFIGLVAYVRARTQLHKLLVVVVSILFILGIGMSRVVLAAHYASDVLAGYLLGAFWLFFVFAVPLRKWSRIKEWTSKK